MGLRDYVLKTGFSKGLIGLSGGIDSAVTAALAVEALGAENVIGISLPSSISSKHSKEDARQLAENLGIEFHTLPIKDLVCSANQTLSDLFEGKRRCNRRKLTGTLKRTFIDGSFQQVWCTILNHRK